MLVALGYNDENRPPTSVFSTYNTNPGPKRLVVAPAPERGHAVFSEVEARVKDWLFEQVAAGR